MLKAMIKPMSTTNIWSKLNSRWPPQHIDLSKHKNGFNSVSFIDIELTFRVLVVEREYNTPH